MEHTTILKWALYLFRSTWCEVTYLLHLVMAAALPSGPIVGTSHLLHLTVDTRGHFQNMWLLYSKLIRLTWVTYITSHTLSNNFTRISVCMLQSTNVQLSFPHIIISNSPLYVGRNALQENGNSLVTHGHASASTSRAQHSIKILNINSLFISSILPPVTLTPFAWHRWVQDFFNYFHQIINFIKYQQS